MQSIARKEEGNYPKIMKENKWKLQAALSTEEEIKQSLLYSTDLLSPHLQNVMMGTQQTQQIWILVPHLSNAIVKSYRAIQVLLDVHSAMHTLLNKSHLG